MPVVSATIQKPTTGTPWRYAEISVAVAGTGMSGGGVIVAGVAHALTDIDGLVTFTLPGNVAGEQYVWTNPDGTQVRFVMPTGGGPYTLDQLTTTGQPAAPDAATATALAALAAQVTAGTHPVSTDGTDSLPTPAGVGLEFVITAAGLDDIRYNGTSL